jgi:hypothetical protein
MGLDEAKNDLKIAADELLRPITLDEIAGECGVSVDSFRRSMLDEGSEAYVPPPRFWRGDLAYLARERAAELVALANELEAIAWAPAEEEELEEIGSQILARFDQLIEPENEAVDSESGLEDVEARWAEIGKKKAKGRKPRTGKLSELGETLRKTLSKNLWL